MSSSAITPVNIEITNNVPTNVPTLTTGQTYSPTLVSVSGSNLGLARTQVTWRQVGNYVHIQGTLVKDANAGTGANAVGITMPSGLTIDFTQAGGTTSTDGFVVGSFGSYNILATNQYDRQLTAYVRGTGGNFANNAVYIQVPATGGTYTASQITANSIMYVNLMIPVAEWAGSGTTTLANRAVEEYSFNTSTSTTTGDTTSFGYGPGGFQIGAITALLSRQVQFQTTQTATDSYVLEISTDRITWQEPGSLFNGQIIDRFRYNGTSFIGAGVSVAGSTVSAIFGQYRTGNSDAWGSVANFYWRIRKVSGGAQVGYPVSARNIVGDTTGTAVPTGMIGERVTWASPPPASYTVSTSIADWTNASITLSSGVWLISASIMGRVSTAATAGDGAALSIYLTDSSNNSVNSIEKNMAIFTPSAAITRAAGTISFSTVVSISSQQTYKIRASVTSGDEGLIYHTSTAYSEFFAVRIA